MFSAPRPEHAITAATFRRHQQGLDRNLPVIALSFLARKGVDVFAGVEQGDELATVGQRDRILEGTFPACLRPASFGQSVFILPTKSIRYNMLMRGIVVAMAALVALSVAMREHPHHAPRPTGSMPAVNVP